VHLSGVCMQAGNRVCIFALFIVGVFAESWNHTPIEVID
jgi:hypothetical protein